MIDSFYSIKNNFSTIHIRFNKLLIIQKILFRIIINYQGIKNKKTTL
jgi:hypothetical protein